MNADLATTPEAGGLATLLNILVAPGAAFATLRERPTWVWAFLITAALGTLGTFLLIPAQLHALSEQWPTMIAQNPQLAAASPERQGRQLEAVLSIERYIWLAFPIIVPVGVMITTLVALTANALSGGDGTFKKLFALAMNVAVINFGLGSLMAGIIATLRGPQSFSSQLDVALAMPTLAWLIPGSPPKVAAMLASLQPFTLWSFVILALGLVAVAKIPRLAAFSASALLLLGGAIVAGAIAK